MAQQYDVSFQLEQIRALMAQLVMSGGGATGIVTQGPVDNTAQPWLVTDSATHTTLTTIASLLSGVLDASVTGTVTSNQGTAGSFPWLVSDSTTHSTLSTISALLAGVLDVSSAQSGSWTVGQSGSWNVGQSGAWTVQPGNTPNTTPWLLTINQGGNSAFVTAGNALKVDGSAVTQPVSISGTVPISGSISVSNFPATQAVTQSGSWSVTANIGTTNGLALDSSVNGLLVTQGSTTSGQSGILTQAAVSTSAPTYSNGKTSPLSLTTAGALRIDGSAVTQPVSIASSVAVTQSTSPWLVSQSGSPWGVNLTQVGGSSISLGQAAMASSLPVVLASNQSSIPVSQSGAWTVSGSGTFSVSGSVTANIGTTNGLALDTSVNGLLVAQGSTTAGQSGTLTMGAVSTASPSYSSTKTSPLSLTTAGALRVDGSAVTQPVSIAATVGVTQSTSPWLVSQSGSPWGMNLTQVGGATVALGQVAMASSIPVTLASNQSALAVSQSGTWTNTVTQATGTNLHTVIDSGTITANAGTGTFTVGGTVTANAGTGTFAVSGSVTANIGTTNGLALDSSVNGLLLAQGSTTSGQSGPLIQGAVSTSAPTLSNTKTSPLSLTTAGALRVDGSAVTQPVSIAASVAVTQSGSWSNTVTQATGTNLHTVVDSGTVAATQSGSWTVAATESGTWTVQPGNTPNTSPWLMTISQGGNSASVTASSALKVDGSAVTQPVSVASTLTVQGSLTNNNAAPSTNNIGALVAVANSAAPTYSAGDMVALSTDLSGNLRITGSISASNPSVGTTGTTAPTSATQIGFLSGANLVAVSGSNPLPITGSISASNPSVGTDGSAIPTSSTLIGASDGTNLQQLLVESASNRNLRVSLWNGTTEASVTAGNALKVDASATTQPVSIASTVGVTQSGTWTNTVTQATGTNLHTVIDSGTVAATQSGTWTNTVTQATGTNLHTVIDSGTVTDNQGTANTLANAWPFKITDATNGPVAVKAASTTPAATDSALVVALSSNIGNLSIIKGLPVNTGAADVFGQLVTAQRLPQISVPFFTEAPSTLLTITTTGTGTTAQGTGLGTFSTGTGTTSESKGVTPTTVFYTPHSEIYAAFTASFTTPTSAASYQRIGLYNTTDGLSFGYNGTTFGLWFRYNSSDTFVAQASWNLDTCSSAAGTTFTSAGAATTLVPTNINLYRVRFGWLGIAPFVFEILSPDGVFVPVHIVRNPNSQTAVSLTTPNLPVTVDVSKTAADATNLTISCGCWVGGSSSPASTSVSGVQSISANGVSILIPTINASSLGWNITGTWSGTLAFQFSQDGINWVNDIVLDDNTGTFVSSTTANNDYETAVGAFKFYRITSTAWSSGTAIISFNGSAGISSVTTQTLITDANGDGPVVVKGASTAALATDASLVVALSPNSPLPAGTNSIGTVVQGTAASLANAWSFKITDTTNGPVAVKAASTAAVASDPALVVAISPNSEVAKGTQGSTALPTQDLKDSGRSILSLTYTNVTSATTTTVTPLTTLVQNSGIASTTGVTNFQVTAGKTLRLQSLTATAAANATTTSATSPQCVYVDVRASTTNTAMASAPIIYTLPVGVGSDQLGNATTRSAALPDGCEIPAGDYVGITVHNANTTVATTCLGICLVGFTY